MPARSRNAEDRRRAAVDLVRSFLRQARAICGVTPQAVATSTTETPLDAPRDSSATIRHRLLHEGLTRDDELRIGPGIAYLLLRTRSWVHRRVELIRFLDADNVQRQMSVDFTLPTLSNSSVADMLRLTDPIVPLTMLGKDRLQRFSVWDEEGAALPMFTSVECDRLAGACLVSMATRIVQRATRDDRARIPDELRRALLIIPAAEEQDALFLLHQLCTAPEAFAADLRVQPQRLHRVFPLGEPPWLDGIGAHAKAIRMVFSDNTFRGIATELASQFVMIVPLQKSPLDRRVVKFTYEQSLRPREQNVAVRRLAKLLESVGWKARRIQFGDFGVGHAASHHIEVEAPEQLEFVDARLTVVDQNTEEDWTQEIARAEVRGDRVHLYEHGASRASLGRVRVRLRVEFVGLPLTAPALALLTAVILLAGSTRSSQVNKEAGVALLLIGPTLLAAFLARPGEHAMATRLLLGTRVFVAVTGLASFLAAGALAGAYDRKLCEIWTVATVAACVAAVVLALGLLARPGTPTARFLGWAGRHLPGSAWIRRCVAHALRRSP